MSAAKIIRQIELAGNEVNDIRDRLAQENGALKAELRKVYAECFGEGMKPQPGCAWHKAWLGDAEVLVEYEYEPEEAPVYNLNSPMCGPGTAAIVSLLGVLVNGKWIEAGEVIQETRDRWEQDILDNELEAAWQDRQDRLSEEQA